MGAPVGSIRQARARVAARIRGIEKQLEGLQHVPPSQPWVSFARVTDVSQLASPHPSLKEALRRDLAALRSELQRLKRRHAQARRRQARQAADHMDREFRGRLERALKDAERKGALDEGTLNDLCEEAEEVLDGYVDLLERNPSRENMRSVLRALEMPMVLGGDTDQGAGARAFKALQRGGNELRNRAEREFRGLPTSNNFRKVLSATATSMMVGGAGLPTRPPGLRKTRPVDRHVVAAGDTLSGLSREFYGKPAYWDVIYLANVGAIDDPDQLRIGTELHIP